MVQDSFEKAHEAFFATAIKPPRPIAFLKEQQAVQPFHRISSDAKPSSASPPQ